MASQGLTRIGGEYEDAAREERFRARQLPGTIRHVRMLFLLSVILNTLFLASDWRFAGTPHFWVAIPARLIVIAGSLLGLALIRRVRNFVQAERVMIGWMTLTGASVAVLVSSHSDIAFFVVIMLPMIFWLAVPTSFRWSAIGGTGCSILMLVGYLAPGGGSSTDLGLALAAMILNAALLLIVTRTNRLLRLEAAASERLADSRRSIERMFNASPVPMLVTRRGTGEVLALNDLARRFFRAGSGGQGERAIDEAYATPEAQRLLTAKLAEDGNLSGFETQVRAPNGSVRDVLISTSLIELDGAEALVSGIVDITKRKKLEQNLARLASTDVLTGLANRARFFGGAEDEIARATETKSPVAVLMIDIDEFKQVNDVHGHDAGDRALKAVSAILSRLAGSEALAARLGGEEFALLLPGFDIAAAGERAEALRVAIAAHDCSRIAPGLRLTVSIGVALVQPGETRIAQALVRADRALYAAKRAGRNRVITAGLNGAAEAAA